MSGIKRKAETLSQIELAKALENTRQNTAYYDNSANALPRSVGTRDKLSDRGLNTWPRMHVRARCGSGHPTGLRRACIWVRRSKYSAKSAFQVSSQFPNKD
jgi:hypothetical protein